MAGSRKASKPKNDNKEFFEALKLMEGERGIPKVRVPSFLGIPLKICEIS